jgi:hypothetical protein
MPRSRFGGWCLLDGDVLHGAGRTRAVPMLLSRRKPHNVAGWDFLDGSAPTLRQADARHDDERLAERMCVPAVRLEQRIDAGCCFNNPA